MTLHCPEDCWPSNDEWLRKFRQKAAAGHIPVAGMIELTKRCNLRCAHCYLDSCRGGTEREPEMTTEEVLSLLDDLASAGCLYLTLTGGDPMIRPDFAEIYIRARTLGMVVTVFCNGTLITDEILDVLSKYPPRAVEVTVYGATAESHDSITRTEGSFAKMLAGIERLQSRGIITALKTIVMRSNVDQVERIEALAEEKGVPFRVDPVIFDRIQGDALPLDELRVDAATAVEVELSSEHRLDQWLRYYESREDSGVSDRLYTCGGGVTGFFVSAEGILSPCLMSTHYRRSLSGQGFAACWESLHQEVQARKAADDYPCKACESRAACTGCAAMNYVETGDEGAVCRYVCDIAKRRHAVLESCRRKMEAGVGT